MSGMKLDLIFISWLFALKRIKASDCLSSVPRKNIGQTYQVEVLSSMFSWLVDILKAQGSLYSDNIESGSVWEEIRSKLHQLKASDSRPLMSRKNVVIFLMEDNLLVWLIFMTTVQVMLTTVRRQFVNGVFERVEEVVKLKGFTRASIIVQFPGYQIVTVHSDLISDSQGAFVPGCQGEL